MGPLLVILSAGTRGDVQPYVALGKGLQEAGYRVRLVTHENFAGLVKGHGLSFAPLRVNPRLLLTQQEARAIGGSGANPVRLLGNMFALFRRFMPVILEDSRRGCQGADGILFSILGFPAYHIAEAMGVPAVGAFLQPQTRTRAFPAPVGNIPRGLRRIGWFNRLTYIALELLTWNLLRSAINRWRMRELGLKPLSILGPYPRLYRGEVPVLYGFSRYVVPPPPDWTASMHVTGYWFLDDARGWYPERTLMNFLEGGSPPIYVGFGSMRPADPERVTQVILDTLRELGLRAILLIGWGGLRPGRTDENVLVMPEVPHPWLFPRVTAVIHHGGAGTTGTGLRAGRPTLIIPFVADQFFWGTRVHDLGVGSAPIPEKRLTVKRLAAALERILHDEEMRNRAGELGDRIRAEDGVGEAVGIVKTIV